MTTNGPEPTTEGPAESRPRPSAAPLVAIPLVVILAAIYAVRGVASSQPRDITISELLRLPVAEARPVRIDGYYYAVSLGQNVRMIDGDRRESNYVALGDESTSSLVLLELARPPSGDSTKDGILIHETIEGTAHPVPAEILPGIRAAAATQELAVSETLVIADGELPPLPAGRVLLAAVTLVGGIVVGAGYHRHRREKREHQELILPRLAVSDNPAEPFAGLPSDTAVARSHAKEEAAYKRAISQAPCPVCGAVMQGFMKLCPHCKLPREAEYFVSATLPLSGFEKYSTLIMKTMGDSEYLVTRTLTRPHMPVPFSPVASLKERYQGGQSDSIHRLVAKGQASFLSAQSLQRELEREGNVAIIVSTEELASAKRPRPAASGQTTLDGLVVQLAGGEAATLGWEDIYLVLVYGEESTAETLTRGGVRDTAGSGQRRNIIDVYGRQQEWAVRIHDDDFDWALLGERRASTAEANFGTFVSVLESHCPEAIFHAVTDNHAGAWSDWRATYYSVWRAMVSRRGADKGRGALAIEGYRMLGEVGKGAWGRVYKAVQERVERTVAIKVLSSQFPRDEKFRERFLREARTAGQLNHPNVVAVIDCNEQRGMHYLVMEFVDGTTLKEIVKTRGPLPEVQALRATRAVARALEHAHARAIVHRDIKPENIFLSHDGQVKLGDWGLAKAYASGDANLTETGAAMGTPNYISPEQVRATKVIDHRADIYSLGATLYFLLVGKPPFPAPTVVEIMTRHLKDPPPDVRAARPGVSQATATIIRKCMEKDPADRYQSAVELLDALKASG